MASATYDPTAAGPKALIFDLMGTCTDWYASILPALQSAPSIPALPPDSLEDLAAHWREGFFKEAKMLYEARQPVEDIDVTHRRVLNWILLARGVTPAMWDDSVRNRLVQAWHVQQPWPDVGPALQRLRQKFIMYTRVSAPGPLGRWADVDSVVLANGSTRLQIDIAKSTGLPFHMILSSELLKQTKPDPGMYTKALQLVQVKPSEAMMVAAHAYDLRAAKKVGMLTAYVQRSTEDPREKMATVRTEVDFFLDGTTGTKDCGFGELSSVLGV